MALQAAHTHEAEERLVGEPVLVALGGEVLVEQGDLALGLRIAQRHIQVGCAQVAVVFWNLVFQDQVIAKGVPGQLAREAMILMQIVPGVNQDHIRRERLERLEELLHLAAGVG